MIHRTSKNTNYRHGGKWISLSLPLFSSYPRRQASKVIYTQVYSVPMTLCRPDSFRKQQHNLPEDWLRKEFEKHLSDEEKAQLKAMGSVLEREREPSKPRCRTPKLTRLAKQSIELE